MKSRHSASASGACYNDAGCESRRETTASKWPPSHALVVGQPKGVEERDQSVEKMAQIDILVCDRPSVGSLCADLFGGKQPESECRREIRDDISIFCGQLAAIEGNTRASRGQFRILGNVQIYLNLW